MSTPQRSAGIIISTETIPRLTPIKADNPDLTDDYIAFSIAEMKKYGIFQSKDKAPTDMVQQAGNDREYEVSYRSGGGMAIAVLAMASSNSFSGEFKNADFLKAAEDGSGFRMRRGF